MLHGLDANLFLCRNRVGGFEISSGGAGSSFGGVGTR